MFFFTDDQMVSCPSSPTEERFGELLQGLGELDWAVRYYRDRHVQQQKLLGDFHPETLQSQNELAMCLLKKGNLDTAEAMFKEVLERRRCTLGNDHLDTLHSINGLGA
ncbi:MAG TPA: tetratricopeptide repeat protein, partial [Planctomycetes bacterium]|nr:tetratricopeptide repeat protein [Planctomycetota bacterium]